MIQNSGDKPTKWAVNISPPFQTNLKEGFLEENKCQQITFTFLPTKARVYRDTATISWDGEIERQINL